MQAEGYRQLLLNPQRYNMHLCRQLRLNPQHTRTWVMRLLFHFSESHRCFTLAVSPLRCNKRSAGSCD